MRWVVKFLSLLSRLCLAQRYYFSFPHFFATWANMHARTHWTQWNHLLSQVYLFCPFSGFVVGKCLVLIYSTLSSDWITLMGTSITKNSSREKKKPKLLRLHHSFWQVIHVNKFFFCFFSFFTSHGNMTCFMTILLCENFHLNFLFPSKTPTTVTRWLMRLIIMFTCPYLNFRIWLYVL